MYLSGTLHVVSEREESIRAEGHGLQGADPVLAFSIRKQLWYFLKKALPQSQVWALEDPHAKEQNGKKRAKWS